jgi:hypothetical protein
MKRITRPKRRKPFLTTLSPWGFGNACLVGQGWISNGHWLLRLDRVKNAADFADVETACRTLGGYTPLSRPRPLEERHLQPFLRDGDAREWITTALILDGQSRPRLLRCGGEIAAVSDYYLRLGDLDWPGLPLYGASTGPLRDTADGTLASFLVMPINMSGARAQALRDLAEKDGAA